MSESVSAAGASGAAQSGGAQAPSAGASSSASQGATSQQAQSGSQREYGAFGQAKDSKTPQASQGDGKSQQAKPDTSADDGGFEEIALGSVKGKVDKNLAKAIKEFERGFQKKFEESAKVRKEAQEYKELLEMLDKNPDEFAKRRGLDLDKFAEERLAKKYELMQMSPEQRELMELKREREDRLQTEKKSKSEVIEQLKEFGDVPSEVIEQLQGLPKEQIAQIVNQKRAEYKQLENGLHEEFRSAWKEVGLPSDPHIFAKMAFEMSAHQKRTGEPLQAKDAAAKVKASFMKSVSSIVSQMDPKGIQELLGDDIMQKLRDFDVERVTAKAASRVGQNHRPDGSQSASESTKKYMNQSEWRKHMGLR